jgi:hypothetical protein
MIFSLVLLTALAPAAPEPAAPSGLSPDQAVAIIDNKGNLRITQASTPCGYGAGSPAAEAAVLVKQGDEKVAIKVKTTRVILTTVELPALCVEAFTVDGKAIAAEKLATLLTKERTVLVALDGKKVDPFLLELYKEGTIVLVPPANTMGRGNGDSGGYQDVAPKGPDIPEKVPTNRIQN